MSTYSPQFFYYTKELSAQEASHQIISVVVKNIFVITSIQIYIFFRKIVIVVPTIYLENEKKNVWNRTNFSQGMGAYTVKVAILSSSAWNKQ
jgi:hypothetical protein